LQDAFLIAPDEAVAPRLLMKVLCDVSRLHAERTQTGEYWEKLPWFRSLPVEKRIDCLTSGSISDYYREYRHDAAGK
jgi:hypothetical protein